MKQLFFSGDEHFYHFRIIKYTNRPFVSIEEMNDCLIRNWNSAISNEDDIIVTGDFALAPKFLIKELIDKLNGNKIFLAGNHDSKQHIQSLILHYYGMQIFVTHRSENCVGTYKLCLCSHIHDKWKISYKAETDTLFINVGVDAWDFKPVNFKDIYSLYTKERKKLQKQI